MSVDPIGSANNVAASNGIDRTVGKPSGQDSSPASAQSDASSALVPSDLRSYLAVGQAVSPQREARIEALREAIRQGAYQPPINTLAQKLLGDGSGQ